MKLQLVETRRGNTVYEKFQVAIKREAIETAGCQPGDEVTFTVDRQKRIVMTFAKPKPKIAKMTLDRFREILFWILVSAPFGLTYAEIHEKAVVLPKKPPAIWVKRLESDGWLERSIDHTTHKMIWKMKTRTTSPIVIHPLDLETHV